MVGVKGKYKGCNTCRKRRVACDNTRPLCKKCTDHGRHCEGYQTETVFIVGTIEDGGRCASHPPRNIQASSSRAAGKKKAGETNNIYPSPDPAKSRRRAVSEGQQDSAKLSFTEVSPLRSCWEEWINVASIGGLHKLKFAAIHTSLKSVRRQQQHLGDWEVKLSLPATTRVDVTPAFKDEDFKLTAECFLHLPKSSWHPPQGRTWEEEKEGGTCLILYEQNSSALYSNKPPWKDPAALENPIRLHGPDAFKSFPGHHFFTRVYRPNEIFAALLNHIPTPLSEPEWTTVPWENSPKTGLDSLLDIISQLPGLLYRSDRILPLQPSISRRLKAKDILANCAAIEAQFGVWYGAVEEAAAKNRDCPLLYWPWQRQCGTKETGQWEQGQIPFQVTYDFPSVEGGLSHIYYWTGLIVLYGIMARLVEVVIKDLGSGSVPPVPQASLTSASGPSTTSTIYLQPQPQAYVYGSASPSPHSYGSVSTDDLSPPPTTAPMTYHPSRSNSPYQMATSPHISPLIASDLPPSVSSAKYCTREIRKLAANVCRSLDWVIGRSEGDGLGPLGQPDLVAAPLHIVERFYESVGPVGEGELERLWCSAFKERWARRGREIEENILGAEGGSASRDTSSGARVTAITIPKSWIEFGKFGV